MLYRIIVFIACLSFSGIHAAKNEWSQFTSLEEEVLSSIFEINTGIGCRDDFSYLQQTAISDQVEKMIKSIDSEDDQALRNLSTALKADTRLAIDMTLLFIDSEGALNKKTMRLFNRWSRATVRLYRAIVSLLPDINTERLGHLLEVRSGELYYMARSIGEYYGKRTEKNYAAMEFHSELAFQYAQELDLLMNAYFDEQDGKCDEEDEIKERCLENSELESNSSEVFQTLID